jgi:hypothetical protein
MPSIRLPQSLEPVLPFCRKVTQPQPNACFDTYADLVGFAAACGFYHSNDRRPVPLREPSKLIFPIDLAIFKNQRLFPMLLMMCLAFDGKDDVARDEERLCQLIEAYAEDGGRVMAAALERSTKAGFHLELAKMLEGASADGDGKI